MISRERQGPSHWNKFYPKGTDEGRQKMPGSKEPSPVMLSSHIQISLSWKDLINYITILNINSWTWVINSYLCVISNFLLKFSYFLKILIKFWITSFASIKCILFKIYLDHDQANIDFMMETKWGFLSFFRVQHSNFINAFYTGWEIFLYTHKYKHQQKNCGKWK